MAGPGFFEWEGKTWSFAPCDSVGVIRQYEAWLLDGNIAELDERRDAKRLTEKKHAEEMACLRADVATRKYKLGGSIYAQSLGQREGQMQLMLLMIRAYHPETPLSFVESIWKTEAGLTQTMRKMGMLEEASPDPNPSGPAAT